MFGPFLSDKFERSGHEVHNLKFFLALGLADNARLLFFYFFCIVAEKYYTGGLWLAECFFDENLQLQRAAGAVVWLSRLALNVGRLYRL